MKVPEMKVITDVRSNDSSIDEDGRFEYVLDPRNCNFEDHRQILAEHFKNTAISNVCAIFDTNGDKKEIPLLNGLGRDIYYSVYALFERFMKTGRTSELVALSVNVLAESMCAALMSMHSPSYIDSSDIRRRVMLAIYKALPLDAMNRFID